MFNRQLLSQTTFDKLAQTYSNKFTYNKTEREKLESLLKTWRLKKGDTVLELGGGTGDLSPFIIKKIGSKGSLVFLDFSPKMIQKAQSKLKKFPNIAFINIDIHNYHQNQLFDKIVIFNTFPHFADKKKALTNCYKALKPKGKLIICHNESRSSICLHHSKKLIENQISSFPDDQTVLALLAKIGFIVELFENNEGYDYYLLIASKSSKL
ncbi:class I SAM-dependent methyltransferase [Candidatus Beckwithbacteria bacterium]|nr:class I SAM-dependent methyltransferase [Candidatus Beckwithbacteria bacterium]